MFLLVRQGKGELLRPKIGVLSHSSPLVNESNNNRQQRENTGNTVANAAAGAGTPIGPENYMDALSGNAVSKIAPFYFSPSIVATRTI